MSDMNKGVEAFRAKLESLGAKNIGIYIGVYFMEEHINSDKFQLFGFLPTDLIRAILKVHQIQTLT